jgi:hypothetical protein
LSENPPTKIHLQPFTTKEVKEILVEFSSNSISKIDDFCDYLLKISRGVPFNIWFFLLRMSFPLVFSSFSHLEPKVKFVINNSISIDKAFFVNCLDAMSAEAHRLVHLLSFVVQPFSLSTIVAVTNCVGIGKAKVLPCSHFLVYTFLSSLYGIFYCFV